MIDLRKSIGIVMLVGLIAAMSAFATGEPEKPGGDAAASGGIISFDGTARVYSTPAEYESETGNTLPSYKESPVLAEMVAAGTLIPVEDRLPMEPLVLQPKDQIGIYGGMVSNAALYQGRSIHVLYELPLRVLPDYQTIVPNFVKSWEFDAPYDTLVLNFREGARWSDGTLFSTEDVSFWWDDIISNSTLVPDIPGIWKVDGLPMQLDVVDDFTVQFTFAGPNPAFLGNLAIGWADNYGTEDGDTPLVYAPKHYLEQFHIDYNAEANDLAKNEGYDTWVQLMQFKGNLRQNTEVPSLFPWVLSEISADQEFYERNPYYWKVDVEGNQLPYIDSQFGFIGVDPDMIVIKAMQGEVHVAGRNMPITNYPLLKENEEQGDYQVILGTGYRGADFAVFLNMNSPDPVKRQVFQDLRARQAFSLAINREEINTVLYYGRGIARQAAVHPTVSFYEDWMGDHYAEYDPQRANELLDEIGMNERDADGYRLGPDGEPFAITLETGPWTVYPEASSMVARYWSEVGINAVFKEESGNIYLERWASYLPDAGTWGYALVTEFKLHSGAMRIMPNFLHRDAGPMPAWYDWLNSDGGSGEEPPPEIKEMWSTQREWVKTFPGSAEYMELGKELLTTVVNGLYVIGTVGLAPSPVVISNSLGNVPTEGLFAADYVFWEPHMGDQWFFNN